jgi:2-amino-4-hydroxy-6-hydroxymethyldihydropteridine diphosphokinase
MDLDILLYGDKTIDTKTLVIPHPRMAERRFVLEPLAEIAPDIIHPILARTAAELLLSLRDRHGVAKLGTVDRKK